MGEVSSAGLAFNALLKADSISYITGRISSTYHCCLVPLRPFFDRSFSCRRSATWSPEQLRYGF